MAQPMHKGSDSSELTRKWPLISARKLSLGLVLQNVEQLSWILLKQNNQSQSRIDLAQGVSRSYFIHWEIESQSQFASDRQTLKIHIKSRNNLYPFITRVSSSLPNHSYYMVKVNRIPFSLSVRDPNTLLMSLFPWGVRKATCGCPAKHRTQSLKNRISLGELRL